MPYSSPPDLKLLSETSRLRGTLEQFAVSRLHEHPDRELLLNRFIEHLSAMKAAAMMGDLTTFYRADFEFHRTMVASANLPVLLVAWQEVWDALWKWVPYINKHYQPSLMGMYREHEFLLSAWFSDEAVVATQASLQHIKMGWQRVALSLSSAVPSGEEVHPVDRATNFLQTHFANEIDIHWLAKHVSFVSSSHLTRSFRQRLGITPYAYLRQLRLERAAGMLMNTPDSVQVVGKKVGYKNASHFVKDFRKVYGVTPKHFKWQTEGVS